MNREQLVEAAAQAIRAVGDFGPFAPADYATAEARAVLDAVLPQVTTVAELQALPDGTRLVRDVDGSMIDRFDGIQHGLRSRSYSAISPEVALMRGSLSVVWQPEAGDRS